MTTFSIRLKVSDTMTLVFYPFKSIKYNHEMYLCLAFTRLLRNKSNDSKKPIKRAKNVIEWFSNPSWLVMINNNYKAFSPIIFVWIEA